MNPIVLVTLFLTALANANPIMMGDWAYISSERLEVNLHQDRAEITGHFTFRSTGADGRFDRHTSGHVSIPIWVPESKQALPELREFLDACSRNHILEVTEQMRPSWDSLFAMVITVGKSKLQPDSFSIIDYTPRMKSSQSHPAFQRKGFSCIVVHATIQPALISRGQTVQIVYRQPLYVSRKYREFYYVPIIGASSEKEMVKQREFAMIVTNQTGRTVSLGGASIPQARKATLPLFDMGAISITANND
jgi:hypothetical protein